jgi:hypothetical protein
MDFYRVYGFIKGFSLIKFGKGFQRFSEILGEF